MEKKKRSGIQLCYPLEERRLTEPKFGWSQHWPVIVQPKLDGVRCRAICNGPFNSLLLSSTESVINSVPHIVRELQELCLYHELDGELYIPGESFETINSIVSRTVNLHEDSSDIQFWIFDLIDGQRQLERLNNLITSFSHGNPFIKIVPVKFAYSFQEIMTHYEDFINQGYEGIIVRHKLAPYIRKRSTFILKFKPKKSDVYKIVGIKQMVDKNGNLKQLLGAIICTSDEGTEFSVGSGMNDSFRRYYYNVAQDLIGRYCKISYQHMTSKGSPRFPIFVKILDENPEEETEITEGIL